MDTLIKKPMPQSVAINSWPLITISYFKTKSFRDNLWALILLLPILLPLGVFWLYPFARSLSISFTDWNYISPDYNQVGLQNYLELLGSDFFAKVLKNTFVFTLFTVLPPLALGLFFSIMLQKIDAFKNFFLGSVFSSWITPAVVVSMVWTSIFDKGNGLVNNMIGLMGFEPVPWLGRPVTAMLVVILVTVWQYTGLTTLLISCALSKLDPEVEKANALDGGSGLRKLWGITLPAIGPTLVFLVVLLTLNSLAAYDQIYILTQGGPAGATSTILYYFYTLSFEFFESGKASALSMIFLGICLLVSALNFVLTKTVLKD